MGWYSFVRLPALASTVKSYYYMYSLYLIWMQHLVILDGGLIKAISWYLVFKKILSFLNKHTSTTILAWQVYKYSTLTDSVSKSQSERVTIKE